MREMKFKTEDKAVLVDVEMLILGGLFQDYICANSLYSKICFTQWFFNVVVGYLKIHIYI